MAEKKKRKPLLDSGEKGRSKHDTLLISDRRLKMNQYHHYDKGKEISSVMQFTMIS